MVSQWQMSYLGGVGNFCCPACNRKRNGVVEVDESIVLDDGLIREVREFCYLGHMLGCEGGGERAVRVRVSSAWRKLRNIRLIEK